MIIYTKDFDRRIGAFICWLHLLIEQLINIIIIIIVNKTMQAKWEHHVHKIY